MMKKVFIELIFSKFTEFLDVFSSVTFFNIYMCVCEICETNFTYNNL